MRAVLLLVGAGCSVGPAREVPPGPLLLPVTLSASGLGGSFRALVFHVDGGLDASPIATNGALGSFEWFEGGAGPSPLELEVVLSTPRTRVQLVRAGGAESNRVRVDGLGEVFAEPPEVPDLVPWFAGPTPRVLIVGRRFDSGRLVDVDGAAPPEGSYRCRRVTIESLQECAMECEVFRRQPLMTNGYVGFGSARSSTRRQAWC